MKRYIAHLKPTQIAFFVKDGVDPWEVMSTILEGINIECDTIEEVDEDEFN